MYAKFGLILLACSCLGAPPSHHDSRIIGGRKALSGEFPFIVSLKRSQTKTHLCGGAILNENWILTAGHCVQGFVSRELIVVSNTTKLNEGDIHSVSRVILHEKYLDHPYEYDLGLLKLSSPLKWSLFVQPIALPDVDDVQEEGMRVIAAGWGLAKYPSSKPPNDLQLLDLELITNAQCLKEMGFRIFENSVCAKAGGHTGVCNGDSGSPLIEAGKNVIVGVVSWGNPCATGIADVYMRISKFVDWINKNAV